MYYNSDPSAFEDLAPLRKDQMDSIMEFFFPDAKPTSGYPYPDNFQDGAKFKKDALNILLVRFSPMGVCMGVYGRKT